MTIDKRAALRRLQVPQKDEEAAVWETSRWLNRDNVPLPPSRRTWGAWSFVGYWCTVGINITGWTTGSSLLSLGLTVGQAMAAVVIGQCIIAFAVVLTGLVGAKWHVGFPLWNRMTWGLKASFFPLINRIILSFTWTATQAWFGGSVLKTLLGSMFPSIYKMRNIFPESSHLTSADFMCFMLFLLISCPLLLVPPEHFRKPFVLTAITSTVTCFSIFFWSIGKGHGLGPLVKSDSAAILGVEPAKGSRLAWMIFYGISSQIGSWCAGILNMSDYSRFAVKPGDQVLSQLIIVPIFGTVTCFIGIVCTSVAKQTFPDHALLWQPYALLQAVQENGGSGARAAVFFASLAFLCSQLGINIACNAVSGGIDLASLFPKYINIRRGAFITTALALPMCPWALVSGATVFISVMGGYATFLGPMTGVMISDFVLIRKQNMKLSSLYECNPSSSYYYWKGVNWRAPVAWAIGVAPLFPGFLSTVSTVKINQGLVKVYYLCWPLGFTLSFVSYYLCAKAFPIPDATAVDEYDIFGTFGDPTFPPEHGASDSRDFEKSMSLENGADIDVRAVL